VDFCVGGLTGRSCRNRVAVMVLRRLVCMSAKDGSACTTLAAPRVDSLPHSPRLVRIARRASGSASPKLRKTEKRCIATCNQFMVSS